MIVCLFVRMCLIDWLLNLRLRTMRLEYLCTSRLSVIIRVVILLGICLAALVLILY